MMTLCNETAERAVLYIMLTDAASCAHGVTELSEADFAEKNNASVLTAIRRVLGEGKVADVVTLTPIVEDHGHLLGIISDFFSPSNFDTYIHELRDIRCRRELCLGLRAAANAAEKNEPDYYQMAQRALEGAACVGSSNILPVGSEAKTALLSIGQQDNCISTGFKTIDNLTKGLRNGELIVIGARPSIGKTSLAMNIAVNVSGRGLPVVVFSLETSKRDLLKRMVFALGSVSEDELLREQRTLGENVASNRAQAAADRIADMPLYIDDRRRITVDQIASQCFGIKGRAKGLALVVIDYLGLIKPFQRKDSTREREIAEMTRALKILAGELDCPIILLSQLSREIDKRPESEPRLSDLRESGAIEQDADIVAFIHRKALNSTDTDIIIAKNRNGKTGAVRLSWLGEYFRFEDEGRNSMSIKGYARTGG